MLIALALALVSSHAALLSNADRMPRPVLSIATRYRGGFSDSAADHVADSDAKSDAKPTVKGTAEAEDKTKDAGEAEPICVADSDAASEGTVSLKSIWQQFGLLLVLILFRVGHAIAKAHFGERPSLFDAARKALLSSPVGGILSYVGRYWDHVAALVRSPQAAPLVMSLLIISMKLVQRMDKSEADEILGGTDVSTDEDSSSSEVDADDADEDVVEIDVEVETEAEAEVDDVEVLEEEDDLYDDEE